MGKITQPLIQRTLNDETETRAAAADLARILKTGDIIALSGTLGVGKTAFARALINALPGVEEEVPSPTFTLVQTYRRGDLEVWHFDLYRLEEPDDAFELGIEDAFADAVSLIEWPDKLGPYLPSRHLRVVLENTDLPESRTLTFEGNASWGERLAAVEKVNAQHD